MKASFLLMVFALNNVVGFACSVGLNLGFHSKHHHEDEATEVIVHVHKNGKQHVHQEVKDGHSHDKSHSHDEVSNKHNSGNDKDNCCSDKVKNFQELDKSVLIL